MTLYPLPAGAEWGDEAADGIDPLPSGWRSVENAAAVWRLVDPDRADRIQAVLRRAVDAGPDAHPWFSPADLAELVEALNGLEDALIEAGILDEHWFVPLDRVAELAARVPAIDAGPERSESAKRQGLAEVLADVAAARIFLSEALVADCSVVLD